MSASDRNSDSPAAPIAMGDAEESAELKREEPLAGASRGESPSEERAARRPARRKKKRRGPPQGFKRDELTPDGRERPRFLLEFPDDAGLNQVIAAFEAGNYAEVRSLVPQLLEESESEAVREALLEIRRRIEPDPLMKYLLLASIGLLLALSWYVYAQHGGHAH